MPNKNRRRLVMQSTTRTLEEATRPKSRRVYGPTPETEAKLERDHLQELLARGGLDVASVESLLEIEEAFGVIESEFGNGANWLMERSDGGGSHEMSDSAAMKWKIWNLWATELFRRTRTTGVKVVGYIQERAPVDAATVKLLRVAATLWDKTKEDHGERSGAKVRHTIMDGGNGPAC